MPQNCFEKIALLVPLLFIEIVTVIRLSTSQPTKTPDNTHPVNKPVETLRSPSKQTEKLTTTCNTS